AARIEAFNERRKVEQKSVVAAATAHLQARPAWAEAAAITLADPRWLPGLVGIAAAGLAQQYRRPVALLALDPERGQAKGSIRSYGTIDVHHALVQCSELLTRFGGHRSAA